MRPHSQGGHGPQGNPGTRVMPSSGTRLWVNVAGLGVWLSGAAWLLLHHFFVHTGELGPEPSALEPWSLKAHGAFAFLTLWTFGLVWGQHIVRAWGQRQRRWSGSLLLAALLVLILTGYLLYYAPADAHELISAVHWVLGLGLPLTYLAHRLLHRARLARRARGLSDALPGAPVTQTRAGL